MIIILCPYVVALWAVFSKFKLVRWGWLSGTISLLVGELYPRNILTLFNYLTPSGCVINRSEGQPRFHSVTSPPCSPSTGPAFGSFTRGIVCRALAWFS